MSATTSNSKPSLLITAFALTRAAVGLSGLLIPGQAASIFGVDANYGSRIMGRLFGARELALGGMLWFASRSAGATTTTEKASQLVGPQHLPLVLWIGLFIDAADMISSTACVLEGSMGGKAIWLVGVGAGVFAALGGIGLASVD